MPTIAVGLIREPEYAEEILQKDQATLIALGRELLWNPNWPAHGMRLALAPGVTTAFPRSMT